MEGSALAPYAHAVELLDQRLLASTRENVTLPRGRPWMSKSRHLWCRSSRMVTLIRAARSRTTSRHCASVWRGSTHSSGSGSACDSTPSAQPDTAMTTAQIHTTGSHLSRRCASCFEDILPTPAPSSLQRIRGPVLAQRRPDRVRDEGIGGSARRRVMGDDREAGTGPDALYRG